MEIVVLSTAVCMFIDFADAAGNIQRGGKTVFLLSCLSWMCSFWVETFLTAKQNDSFSPSEDIWCHSLIVMRLHLCTNGHLGCELTQQRYKNSIKPHTHTHTHTHTHQISINPHSNLQQWAMRGLKTDHTRARGLLKSSSICSPEPVRFKSV